MSDMMITCTQICYRNVDASSGSDVMAEDVVQDFFVIGDIND